MLVALVVVLALPLHAATFCVDGSSKTASDTNPGTEAEPWKTLARAGSAAELAPGDTVLLRSGVYREHFTITVSGAPDQPVTFAAAPGARVVLKASEIVRGPWTRVKGAPGVREPFPNAFIDVWRIPLSDAYFTDPDFAGGYADKSKRWVSQVVVDDNTPLQLIGPDPIYVNKDYPMLPYVGRGLNDLTDRSFFFDAADQMLYIKMGGEPGWFNIEIGVRGWALTASKVHDVVIRGLEARCNRQPGGQWPMCSLGECERVLVENCRFYYADFCGFGMYKCKNCTLRGSDLSYNGNTGFGMSLCEDCVVDGCTLLFNNYRHFSAGWHSGGMKCIPGNKRCTIENCEAAYNAVCPGIWFDADNEDIRILNNICHHNESGIFFEINGRATPDSRGGLIAGNLCYANQGRGIYDSGSRRTWIVHNTVALNGAGIVCMPREDPFKLDEVEVRNNLLIANYTSAATITRGCDLILFMGAGGQEWEPTARTNMTVHSDYNVYAGNSWVPFMRHSWNPDNTLEQWRQRFGEDLHSAQMPIDFEQRGTGFKVLTTTGLDIAGPLPAELKWKPDNPSRVGASRTSWP
jgi:hypothetical protein